MSPALKTGIPKLDELLLGGIPEGAAVLITGLLGADIETFGQQIASKTCESAQCLYFVSDKMPSLVRERMGALKFPSTDKLHFVDGYSASIGMSTIEEFHTKKSGEIEGVISEAAKKVFPKLLVFDSLSSSNFANGKSFCERVTDLSRLAKSFGAVAVFLFPRLGEEDEAFAKELSKSFEETISIDSVAENFIERSFYTVSTKGEIHVPFKVTASGISLYVPKIIVTGPYHSGKSTFIHKISTKAISVDRLGTTVALDHGCVEYKGFSVDLFGTPGQEAFNFILPIISRDTFGVILIVDSSDRNSFPRAREMIDLVSGGRIPFVVAANKSDLPGVLVPDEIRALLTLGTNVPIIKTVSTTGEGIFETLVALFDIITGFRRWN
ncbi:MAG: GTP-binding protein [archaeon]